MSYSTKGIFAVSQIIRELKYSLIPITNNNLTPSYITIDLTNICNLKCQMCTFWKNTTKFEISETDWKFIISKLNHWLGSFHLTISGGEPLLRKDIFNIINYSANKNILTTIISNGTLLNDYKAKQLCQSNLGSIVISLDSPESNLHDFIRGINGSFEKTINGIKLLRKYSKKQKIFLATILFSFNEKNIDYLFSQIVNLNIDGIYFQPLIYRMPENIKNRKNEFLKKKILEKKQTKVMIEKLIKYKIKKYPILNSTKQLNFFKEYYNNHESKFNQIKSIGYRNIWIDSIGNIKIDYFEEPIGNAVSDDIKTVYFSKKARLIREKLKHSTNASNLLNCYFDDHLLDKITKFHKFF